MSLRRKARSAKTPTSLLPELFSGAPTTGGENSPGGARHSTGTDAATAGAVDTATDIGSKEAAAAKPRARNWKTMERTNYREFQSLRRGEVKTLFDQKYGGEEVTISPDGFLSSLGQGTEDSTVNLLRTEGRSSSLTPSAASSAGKPSQGASQYSSALEGDSWIIRASEHVPLEQSKSQLDNLQFNRDDKNWDHEWASLRESEQELARLQTDGIHAYQALGLNADTLLPEVVLLGPHGHGKSTLVQALLSQPVHPIAGAPPYLRPILYEVVHRPEASTDDAGQAGQEKTATTFDDYQLERDPLGLCVPADIHSVASELLPVLHGFSVSDAEPNVSQTPIPIRVRRSRRAPESPQFRLLDLPGLRLQTFSLDSQNSDARLAAPLEALTRVQMRKPTRILIAVVAAGSEFQTKKQEAAQQPSIANGEAFLRWLASVDPNPERTIFCVSNLYGQLCRQRTNPTALRGYLSGVQRSLSGARMEMPSFVTLPSHTLTGTLNAPVDLQRALSSLQERDEELLTSLGVPCPRELGVIQLRRRLLCKFTAHLIAQVNSDLSGLHEQQRITGSAPPRLPQTGSHRVELARSQLVCIVGRVMRKLTLVLADGRVSDPSTTQTVLPQSVVDIYGQTVSDEVTTCEKFLCGQLEALAVTKELTPGLQPENRLLGMRQLDRLLASFVAAGRAIPCAPLTDVSLLIMSDTYARTTHSERDAFTGAVAVVHEHAIEQLSSLIGQVADRSRSILVHCLQVAQRMEHTEAAVPTGARVLVQHAFEAFLDHQLQIFRDRVTEELGTSGSLLLEYRMFGKRENKRVLHTPADLALELHNMLCTRVLSACQLRFLQVVVEPIRTRLVDVLLHSVSALSDEQALRLTLHPVPVRYTPSSSASASDSSSSSTSRADRMDPQRVQQLDRLLAELRLAHLEQLDML